MNAIDAFLYGMPFVLVIGAGVTLWFAKRAARDIESHSQARRPVLFVVPQASDGPDGQDQPRVGAL